MVLLPFTVALADLASVAVEDFAGEVVAGFVAIPASSPWSLPIWIKEEP